MSNTDPEMVRRIAERMTNVTAWPAPHATGQIFGVRLLSASGSLPMVIYQNDAARPRDWWRCDSCRQANPLKEGGKLILKCQECGAPIPERYDT